MKYYLLNHVAAMVKSCNVEVKGSYTNSTTMFYTEQNCFFFKEIAHEFIHCQLQVA